MVSVQHATIRQAEILFVLEQQSLQRANNTTNYKIIKNVCIHDKILSNSVYKHESNFFRHTNSLVSYIFLIKLVHLP